MFDKFPVTNQLHKVTQNQAGVLLQPFLMFQIKGIFSCSIRRIFYKYSSNCLDPVIRLRQFVKIPFSYEKLLKIHVNFEMIVHQRQEGKSDLLRRYIMIIHLFFYNTNEESNTRDRPDQWDGGNWQLFDFYVN